MRTRDKIAFWVVIGTIGVFCAAGCVKQGMGPTGEDVRSQIAEAYGIASMGRIQKLQYTFTQKDADSTLRRFWIWEPAADRVTFKGDGHQPAVTYDRKDLAETASQRLKELDSLFLHDNYWLVLPFRVAWDHRAQVADMGLCRSPLGGEAARCVNVVYPPTVEGHIIGDTYKLFLDGDFRILASIYQPAESAQPERVMRWSNNRLAGPIVLSLTRTDEAGQTVIEYTRVGVEVDGKWYWAN